MYVIKIEQVTAQILTFADGSQKIAFDIAPKVTDARPRINNVIDILSSILINRFRVIAKKQYTTVKGLSPKSKNALYLVESEKGIYLSVHKDIIPIGKYVDSDARFPSTSRQHITSFEELTEFLTSIKMPLDLFLCEGVK